ncbi:MAG: type II secretion system major pseudopilin GspG [Hahellaceae bacterium]|jgi:general secretion pathway protein G|nr:type II secretion system major pseudopilin GspG [Hahellaceae bacterium]MCP5212973.1 type II secretion system major pseudopilin GspG [Hahellaceae bacterium]
MEKNVNNKLAIQLQGKKQAGFTLIEIMVVMVILGLLVAIVAPNILGRGDEARIGVAKAQLRNVANALDMYKLDNYNYPSTEQGLEALVSKPSGFPEAKNWNKDGYLQSLPIDPWDVPYQYLSPGAQGPYDLYSLGADGKEGGEGDAADVSIWALDKK